MTQYAGPTSGAISNSYRNMPCRPGQITSCLATYGRCSQARPGARTSAYRRRTSASTSRGTVGSQRRTRIPRAQSCAAPWYAARWASAQFKLAASTRTIQTKRPTSGVSPSPLTSPSRSLQLSMPWRRQYTRGPLGVRSVCGPTAQVHAANDAPMVRGYKYMT